MSDITQEIFEAMHESARAHFELDAETQSYVPIAELKNKALKASMNGLDTKLKDYETQSKLEKVNEQARIDAAAEAKYQTALKENDTDAIIERHKQMAADAQNRAEISMKEVLEIKQGLAKKQETAIIDSLLSNATERGKATLKRLLKDYVSVDPETSAVTYLNDDGSASSLNKEQFIAEQLLRNPVFESCTKGTVVTEGGGLSEGGSRTTTPAGTPKTLEECKGDRTLEAAFFNSQF